MKLVKRKTRKAIKKSVSKAIDKHGPQIAAAVVGGIASTLATLAGAESSEDPGKSKLTRFAEKVTAGRGRGDDEPAREATSKHDGRPPEVGGRDPRLEAANGESPGERRRHR